VSELREAARAVVREFMGKGSVSEELFVQLPQPAYLALLRLALVIANEPANVVDDGPIGPASQPAPTPAVSEKNEPAG